MHNTAFRWSAVKLALLVSAALAAGGYGPTAQAATPLTSWYTYTYTAGDLGGQVIAPTTFTALGPQTAISCPAVGTKVCTIQLTTRVWVDYGPGGDNRIYLCGFVDGKEMDGCYTLGQPSGAQQTFSNFELAVGIPAGAHALQAYIYTSKGLHAHNYLNIWQLNRVIQ